MAGLEDFVQSLLLGQQAKAEIAKSDPYAGGVNLFNSLGNTVQQAAASPNYSTKDKLIAGLVTGLMGGGLQGVSEDYQARAKSAYDDVLGNAMLGKSVERPDVLSRSIFADANNQGSVFRTMQALKQKDAEAAYDLARRGKIEDAVLDKTGFALVDGKKTQLFDPADLNVDKTMKETIAKLRAEDTYYGGGVQPSKAAFSPAGVIVDPVSGDAVGTAVEQPEIKEPTLADLDPRSPDAQRLKSILEVERGYTEKLLDGTQAKQVLQMNSAAKNIMEALKSNNPTAASTAIVEYAKLQDPLASVRESDELRVSDAGGPLGRLAQLRSEMIQEGKLTAPVKQAMRELVPMLLANKFAEYDQIKNAYLEAAAAQGLNKGRIKYITPVDLSGYNDAPPLDRDALIAEAQRRGLKF